METSQQNLDALAARYGGTVAQDHDAIAVKYGGSVSASQPAQPTKPSTPSLLQRLGLVPTQEQINSGNANTDDSGFGQPADFLISGLQSGAKDLAKYYATQGPGAVVRGAGDVLQGNIAKGGHQIISGAGVTLAPLAPEAIVSNPVMALRAAGGAFVGSNVAQTGADLVGATPDQKQFAGDLGGLAGGGAASTGLLRALFQSPARELIRGNEQTILNILQPRKAIISKLQSMLNDAIATGDVPSDEEATQKIADAVQEATQSTAQPQPQAQTQPTSQPQPTGYKLPNATYLRGDIRSQSQQPPIQPKNYLDGIREWEFIRKVHAEMDQQLGDGEQEVLDWINSHNQNGAGAIKAAPPAPPAGTRQMTNAQDLLDALNDMARKKGIQ